MSGKELKSKIFSDNFNPQKALEEWAEKIKQCEETIGHEYKWRIVDSYHFIRRQEPIAKGRCIYCGHPTARELTPEEKREVYKAREEVRKSQNRHVMK